MNVVLAIKAIVIELLFPTLLSLVFFFAASADADFVVVLVVLLVLGVVLVCVFCFGLCWRWLSFPLEPLFCDWGLLYVFRAKCFATRPMCSRDRVHYFVTASVVFCYWGQAL